MTNYCSRFIPDYTTKTEPLHKLTHKDQSRCWTEEHDHTVSQLKQALVSAPVTAYCDPVKDTEISIDASPVGVAAILSQVDPKTRQVFPLRQLNSGTAKQSTKPSFGLVNIYTFKFTGNRSRSTLITSL